MNKNENNIEKTQTLKLQDRVEKKSISGLLITIFFILITILVSVGIAFLVHLAKQA